MTGYSRHKADSDVEAIEHKYAVMGKAVDDTEGEEIRNCIKWDKPTWKVAPKAVICIAHGIFEHGMAYDELARILVSNGYVVHAIDHRGHGFSSGKRGFVHDYTTLVEDFVSFVDMVRGQYSKDLPFFIYGHSMGSMITMAALNRCCSVAGVLISGFPADNGPGSTCLFGIRAFFFISKLPITPVVTSVLAGLDPEGDLAPLIAECVTSDEEVRKRQAQDKRRCESTVMKNRTADELRKLRQEAVDAIPAVTTPIMFIHGAEDEIGYAAGSVKAFGRVGTIPEQKGIKIYPGLRHEPINEVQPARDGVYSDILGFFQTRLLATGPTGRPFKPNTGGAQVFKKKN